MIGGFALIAYPAEYGNSGTIIGDRLLADFVALGGGRSGKLAERAWRLAFGLDGDTMRYDNTAMPTGGWIIWWATERAWGKFSETNQSKYS